MLRSLVLTLLLGLCAAASVRAGGRVPAVNLTPRPQLLTQRWQAQWIAPAESNPFDFGVHHFRRVFRLESRPDRFVVHVSGDNRYQLFVNGRRVLWGPARGDLNHWRFETVDLAPYLQAGENVLAAVVWNFGPYAPEAQVTNQTGFLLQGDGETERVASTGGAWRCRVNPAYQPLPVTHGEMRGYFVAGPGERIDGSVYPWGWEQPGFDATGWTAPRTLGPGSPRFTRDGPNRWMLVPREIPLMGETPQRFARVRQSTRALSKGFPDLQVPVRVEPGTTVRMLLDQDHLTTGYPEVVVSGGRGGSVSLRYAEALFETGPRRGAKGNRSEVEGKEFVGYRDLFLPDGGARREFRPLWWRTWRYVELTLEAKDDPLVLEDIRSTFCAYPFQRTARFDAPVPRIREVLDVGWRTARLCAHETYMDCPYYEQLQYVGDTRLQCLVSLYETGDARLMRNALRQIDDSRTAEGATMSRAPTRQQQYIPPFSLWWIGMLHDYWRHVDDPALVRELLPGVRAVLTFYARYQKENGSLRPMPWWNFLDWTNQWRGGDAPQGPEGDSAPLNLQLLLAYQWAAELEAALGSPARARECREAARTLAATIEKLYWTPERGLFADTPERKAFSQHTNALAVVAGVASGRRARDVVERALADGSLVPASFYFRHYLHEAMNQAGLGDRYPDQLGDWHRMLDAGLTTWAERPDYPNNASRSDCHAWSSHPNYQVFRTVLGIAPAAPGFARVELRPHLGALPRAAGSIPHPKGRVEVSYVREGGALAAEIALPEGVPGVLVWQGRRVELRPGRNRVRLEPG